MKKIAHATILAITFFGAYSDLYSMDSGVPVDYDDLYEQTTVVGSPGFTSIQLNREALEDLFGEELPSDISFRSEEEYDIPPVSSNSEDYESELEFDFDYDESSCPPRSAPAA